MNSAVCWASRLLAAGDKKSPMVQLLYANQFESWRWPGLNKEAGEVKKREERGVGKETRDPFRDHNRLSMRGNEPGFLRGGFLGIY